MFTEAAFIVTKKWEPSKGPSLHQWKKKVLAMILKLTATVLALFKYF